MQIEEANSKQIEKWDDLIDNSINGTLFHKRNFLKYHRDKFKDKEKFLVILKGSEVIVQISLAIFQDDKGNFIAKSPYGASYGGFVFQKVLSYSESTEVILLFIKFLKDRNIKYCFLTHSIACCSEVSMDTFYFTLLENGFVSVGRNISSVMLIDKKHILEQVSASVRRKVNHVDKNLIKIIEKPNLEQAYDILNREQKIKFGTLPTHTLEEFIYLHKNFPNEIETIGMLYQGEIIAGITYFKVCKKVMTSFYIYMKEEYKDIEALRPLMVEVLQKAQEKQIQYFDFGTSSVNMVGKSNIFKFKEGFSKQGMFRETFKYEC